MAFRPNGHDTHQYLNPQPTASHLSCSRELIDSKIEACMALKLNYHTPPPTTKPKWYKIHIY